MRALTKRFFRLLTDERRFLWNAVGVFSLALFAVCALKWAQFRYDGFDLAYFTQVLWNTVHGRPFVQSLHPHLSLGDHAEFVLLVLALPFALLRHPLTLLALQAFAVVAPALIIHRIAEERYRTIPAPFGMAPLLLAFAWLMNVSVHGMAVFEFHALPFALAPLLLALLAYERSRMLPFVGWSLAALLVREDVAIVVAAIGVLAWLEKRPRVWLFVPIALGATWFLGAMALISRFAPAGGYKFAVYYSWLWQDGGLAKLPGHLFTLANLEMFLAFMTPLAFLPLLAPRRLVLLLAPLAQIVLSASGGGDIVARTHYATLFLPGLFLAAIDGASAAPRLAKTLEHRFGGEEWRLVPALALLVAPLYCMLAFGPLPRAVPALFDRERWHVAAAARDALRPIGQDEPVVAPYALLPRLAMRDSLYAVHYVFLGVSQFAERPYPPPTDLRYTVVDERDLIDYAASMPSTAWAAPFYAEGRERLARTIGPRTYVSGPFGVHDRDARPFEEALRAPITGRSASAWSEGPVLAFARIGLEKEPKSGVSHLRLEIVASAPERADRHVLRIETLDERGEVRTSDLRPLLGLAMPPSQGDRIESAYDVRLPSAFEPASVRLTLYEDAAMTALDPLGSTEYVPLRRTERGVIELALRAR